MTRGTPVQKRGRFFGGRKLFALGLALGLVVMLVPGGVVIDAALAGETPQAASVTSPEVPETVKAQIEVLEVERTKPKKQKKPSLEFLKENVSFLRARIDLLRESIRMKDGDPQPLDPELVRFLQMGAEIDQDRASLDDGMPTGLMDSVAELAQVEAELDRLDQLVERQNVRLHELHSNFVDRQRTSLVVVVRGGASSSAEGISLELEGRGFYDTRFAGSDQSVLEKGGVVELCHELVEPRAQWLGFAVVHGTGQTETAYVTFEPERDRMHLLELDLTGAETSGRVEDLSVRFWAVPDLLSEAGGW